jgi:uncharacterized membrane protein YphA (DoxX/SURF4 family)
MPIDPMALFVALPIVALTSFGVFFLCRAWAEDGSQESPPTAESEARYSKLFTAATWVLALLYLLMGLPKLGSLSDVVHRFESHWGYSETFMYVVGTVEFFGAIGLLLPKIRLISAMLLGVIMSGAIYTHLAFDPAFMVLLPGTCLALLVFVGFVSYRDEWVTDV